MYRLTLHLSRRKSDNRRRLHFFFCALSPCCKYSPPSPPRRRGNIESKTPFSHLFMPQYFSPPPPGKESDVPLSKASSSLCLLEMTLLRGPFSAPYIRGRDWDAQPDIFVHQLEFKYDKCHGKHYMIEMVFLHFFATILQGGDVFLVGESPDNLFRSVSLLWRTAKKNPSLFPSPGPIFLRR